MNFDFTEAEQAFADEVRRFLRANPPETFAVDGMDAGYGSGANSRAFMRALGAQGWLSMCWPKSLGGREQPMFMKLVLMEELALAGAPFGPLAGVWQTADAIIELGTGRLRREVLPAIARGETASWQGYSGPDAGSDLLALKTEARRDGDDYVIRGHKIWSSHAGIATHGLVFARTSREARRSRGFSMFVVANSTPGMDIRPIRSMTGEVYHHEVFLDDVRVPADLMLGPPGEGFQALLNGLDADRFWGRFYKAPALARVLRQLVDYANTTRVGGAPLAHDPSVRRRLAAIAADIAALRLVFYRAGCLIRDGAPLTYETAMAKVYADETGQKLARLAMDLLGIWGPLREGSRWAKLGGHISHLYQTTLGHTIAGGTAEILRTSVAVRGLGLPAGSPAQHKRMLPTLAAGERIASLALVEESGSFEPASVGLACAVAGRLSGRKLFVKDAHVADDLVVAVRIGAALSLLVVPTDRPGIARLPLDAISGEKLFEVTFDRVEVRPDDLLGRVGDGAALLPPALRAGALARTAEMVGGAQRVLELVVEHAKTRVQGGRPIGGYQAIQHACADLVRDVDAARALLYAAAWKDAEGRAAEADAALAKAYAADACLAVARRGHQIFGAISYCEEHPLHLLHKRIQAASLDFGDAQLHLETVARAIGLEGRL